MSTIEYREHELYCEEVPVRELAEEYGTPLYIYSKNRILDNYRAIANAMSGLDSLVCYALKANSNMSVLKMLAAEGAGADVVSAGEVFLAMQAGFTPDRIAFAGVGKREDELAYALDHGVRLFNVESVAELQLLSLVALRRNTTARVSLRINPDIDAQSHPYITTGLATNKFGIEASQAPQVYALAKTLPGIDITGIHVHVGSQITRSEPFVAAAEFIASFVPKMRAEGINLQHIDFGGGFGVRYVNAIRHEALPLEGNAVEPVTSPAEILAEVRPLLEPLGGALWIEPGRSIVADAGALLTRVLYIKENSAKKFVIVDAAMTDLLRPSLYNAYHQIVPASITTYDQLTADVVGPVCETGDFMARDRVMNRPSQGDLLAVLTAGAYGFVNTSHYNARPRPAEVLVNGDRVRLVRPRGTFEDLL
jgi:diaminopimelate decarboxylase